jgi:hypothetical protein
VSLLPLSFRVLAGQARYMSIEIQTAVRRIGADIADFFIEWHDAQRMLYERRLAPELYVFGARRTSDTYADFLFATSGPLRHEPPARLR